MNSTEEYEIERAGLDLRGLILLLWKRRWWVIGCVALSTVAFSTAAFVITPVYRSTVVLVPASSERGSSGVLGSALSQLGGLASLAGISVGSNDSETEEALAVLRSRQFVERFIGDNNLMPKLFSSRWDAANGKWKVDQGRQPTPAKAFKYFNEKISSIVQDKKTGLITLQIDWQDRAEAAHWANELVQRLNQEMRARAIAKADASVGYLENELKATSIIGTQEAINRLIEAQVKQRMLANVSQEYAFRVVDKAMAADVDDPVKPKKLMMIILGPIVGFALAIVFVVIFALGMNRGAFTNLDRT